MVAKLVGLSRFELLTPRLSSVCSNQLSYRPKPLQSLPPRCKEPGFAKASTGKPLHLLASSASHPLDGVSAVAAERRRRILSKLNRTCAHNFLSTTRSINFQVPRPYAGVSD